MTLTIDLETMSFKEKMLLVGQVMRSCEEPENQLTSQEKAMLEQSIKEKDEGAKLIPFSEVQKKVQARYE